MSENSPLAWLERQTALIGVEGTEHLYHRSVAIFGVGGVGGYVVEALARAGIGRLILVDHDTVSPSNRNRQIIALCSTVGQPKVDVFASRIADISPDCTVRAHQVFVTPDNAAGLIEAEKPDFIVDAIDHMPGKLAIALAARDARIPLIASMGTGNKLDPSRFRVSDLSKTSVCPLARHMRIEARKRGITHMSVLWSDELPARAMGDARVPASISFVPSSAGLLIASHVVRAILAGEEEKYTIPPALPC